MALLPAKPVRVADSASSTPLGMALGNSGHSPTCVDETVEAGERAAAWLQGRLTVSVSVGALQLAALSGVGPKAAAVVLSVDRLSARLGAIRAGARPGSLTAQLFLLYRCKANTHLVYIGYDMTHLLLRLSSMSSCLVMAPVLARHESL